jgi:hypothetical protein
VDVSISATESERQRLAAEDGLQGLAKLEGSLHVTPWRSGGVAVSGEMRARITQTCVVSLDPFDSELVEPIDVKFAPIDVATEAAPLRIKGAVRHRAPRRDNPPPTQADLGAEDPPDPIIDGRVDLGVLVAEFLALSLDPYPRKPGVEFAEGGPLEPADPGESPFAKLQALKARLPPSS